MSIFTNEDVITNTPLPVDGSGVTQPVSGSVSVTNFPATQNVAITSSVELEIKNDAGSPIPVSGSVTTTPVVSSSSTVAQVTATGSNQTLLAANASRKKVVLYFNTGIWYIKFGATASVSSKTYTVIANNTTIEITTWTGIIDAFCTTAGPLVDVTEMI